MSVSLPLSLSWSSRCITPPRLDFDAADNPGNRVMGNEHHAVDDDSDDGNDYDDKST